MKHSKIYFQRNYPVDNFQYAHYGVEIIIEEGDSIDDAFKAAKDAVSEQYRKDNPQITWSDGSTVKDYGYVATKGFDAVIEKREDIEQPIDNSYNLMEEMKKCVNPKVFRMFDFMCQTDEEKAFYRTKFKELHQCTP